MKEDRRTDRRRQIEAAASELLLEKGYAGTSMLDIAKRARASNETLYRWYGDKLGLFSAIVESNAAAALARLQQPVGTGMSLEQQLVAFGEALLQGILSENAVALNRAAAADVTGDLGLAISRHGRESIVPILQDLLSGCALGSGFENVEEAADTFLSLLIGDMQARRIIGRLAVPDRDFCEQRARKASERFVKLTRL